MKKISSNLKKHYLPQTLVILTNPWNNQVANQVALIVHKNLKLV